MTRLRPSVPVVLGVLALLAAAEAIVTSRFMSTFWGEPGLWSVDIFFANLRHHIMPAMITIVLAIMFLFFRTFVGVHYRRASAWLATGLWGISLVALALPNAFGWAGMPQRYVDYTSSIAFWEMATRVGQIVALVSLVVFALCVAEALYRRLKHGKDSLAYDDRPADYF